MKLAKQETHSTNDHSPPKIRHSFQTRDASMHGVFNTHIGDETEHTAIGEVELVILVRAPLADVVHKFKFIEFHNQLLFVRILVSNIYSQPQILIRIHQLSQSSFLMILSVFKRTTSQLPLLHKTYQHLVVLLILTL
jgi:hypothetical protein